MLQTGSVSPTLGVQPVLVAFIATVLGGMGSLRGAVLGGFTLGLRCDDPAGRRTCRSSSAPTATRSLFGAVILVLLLRPQGLLPGRYTVERV